MARAREKTTGAFRRTIGRLDLIFMGVGGIVGTGVFVLGGRAAALHAGPAVVISFLLAGIAALLAGLCYADAASQLPSAGGAYVYVKSALGGLPGWMVGWDLLLEYFIGNAVVAIGWSGYATSFLENAVGLSLDWRFCNSPVAWTHAHGLIFTGAYGDMPALVSLLGATYMLGFGLRETSRFNGALVILKLTALLCFVVVALPHVSTKNLVPFMPPNQGSLGNFGPSGVLKGASLVFFSYVGFDALVTAGQELRNPRKNIPISIFTSLAVCTVIYMLTTGTLTALVPYGELDVANPISFAARHTKSTWVGNLVDISAVAGLSSSLLMGVMAQPRIVYAMAQDGLLPHWLARIDRVHNAPLAATNGCGVTAALICLLASHQAS